MMQNIENHTDEGDISTPICDDGMKEMDRSEQGKNSERSSSSAYSSSPTSISSSSQSTNLSLQSNGSEFQSTYGEYDDSTVDLSLPDNFDGVLDSLKQDCKNLILSSQSQSCLRQDQEIIKSAENIETTVQREYNKLNDEEVCHQNNAPITPKNVTKGTNTTPNAYKKVEVTLMEDPKDEEIKRLSKEYQDAQKKIELLEMDKTFLLSKLSSNSSEDNSAQEQHKQLQIEMREKQKTITDIEAKNQALREEKLNAMNQVHKLEYELNQVHKNYEEVVLQHSHIQLDHEKEMIDYRNDLKLKLTELSDAQSAYKTIKNELEESHLKIDHLHSQIMVHERQFSKLEYESQREICRLKQELKNQEEQLQIYVQSELFPSDNETVDEEIQEIQKCIKTRKHQERIHQVAQLVKKCLSLKKTKDKLLQSIQEGKKLNKELEKKLEVKELSIQQMSTMLCSQENPDPNSSSSSSSIVLMESMNQLQYDLKCVRFENEKLKQELEETEKKRYDVEQSKIKLHQEKQQQQKQKSSLEVGYLDMKKQLEDMKSVLLAQQKQKQSHQDHHQLLTHHSKQMNNTTASMCVFHSPSSSRSVLTSAYSSNNKCDHQVQHGHYHSKSNNRKILTNETKKKGSSIHTTHHQGNSVEHKQKHDNNANLLWGYLSPPTSMHSKQYNNDSRIMRSL